jgi:hypothetical protein
MRWLFTGRNGRTEPAEAGGTAIEYVNWLLAHMLKTSVRTLVVRTSQPLPGSRKQGQKGGPPCMPEPSHVINRLKLLCELDPVTYARATRGRFDQQHETYTLRYKMLFEDTGEESACTIELLILSRDDCHSLSTQQ